MDKLPIKNKRIFVKWTYYVLLLLLHGTTVAQLPETPIAQQQLENLTAGNDDAETEDDTDQLQMEHFRANPINLNVADAEALAAFWGLSPLQINSLLVYRKLMGPLINLYELQAVPGWDLSTILRMRPYITASDKFDIRTDLRKRFSEGSHTLLLRATQVLERAKGYQTDSGVGTHYKGSPQKILLRYRYAYKDVLQYGLLGEKDAGEQFFKGAQRHGFDFYSAHLFVRNWGNVKALAVGDFTVNLGQGLVQWQGLAFKKSADVIQIKRQAAVLRPYQSAGETNFQRGMGITLGKRAWQASIFLSSKPVDANRVVDSFANPMVTVTALQTAGYHRTPSELNDKGAQHHLAWGGNITWQHNGLQLGLNMVQHRFKWPIVKANEPYNQFALNGKIVSNYSLHYSYTYKNAHFFGEFALGNAMSKAFITGLLVSVAAPVDLALLYRNMGVGYQAIQANAFTESSSPNNEKGVYVGISIRPTAIWRLDAYADFYRFPWLRFRVDAPSHGADYLLQATYKPSKDLEIYTRYRAEAKALNTDAGDRALAPTMARPRQSWRTQIEFKLRKDLVWRSRAEMVWYNKNGADAEQGFLLLGDLLYKPLLKPFAANMRLQYFETNGYNARLYAYENDVLYSYSIPAFYNSGLRWYINLNYDWGKKLGFWVRLAQTAFRDRPNTGTGLDEIPKSRKTELKIQVRYSI